MKSRIISRASYFSYELFICLSPSVGLFHVNMSVTHNPLIDFSTCQYIEIFTFLRTAALTLFRMGSKKSLTSFLPVNSTNVGAPELSGLYF